MRIPREVDQNMTPWLSFNKIILRTSVMIYGCVSYAVLLQGTMKLAMELQMEQDFVMHEEITMTDNCLHDEVRIFVGVSALRVSSALVFRYSESWRCKGNDRML